MTYQKLIDMLVANPLTEREIGYNCAVIEILNEMHGVAEEGVTHAILVSVIPNYYINAKYEIKSELKHFLGSNQKLAFIKILKGLSGLGLKEAKELADLAWDKFRPYR